MNHAVCANGLLPAGGSTNVNFKEKVFQSTIKSVKYSPCMVYEQLHLLLDSGRVKCSRKRINLDAFHQCVYISVALVLYLSESSTSATRPPSVKPGRLTDARLLLQ